MDRKKSLMENAEEEEGWDDPYMMEIWMSLMEQAEEEEGRYDP